MKYKKTIIILSLFLLLLTLIFPFILGLGQNLRIGKIYSNSMYPEYAKGDAILYSVKTDFKKLKRFDIVIFSRNQKQCVKRIIGLPKDCISFLNNGVIINEEQILIPEKIRIIFDRKNKLQKNRIKFDVPANSFFVIGDNLPESIDSRFYGSIPRNVIYGIKKNQ